MQAGPTQSTLQVVEERMHVLSYHWGIMYALGLHNEPATFRRMCMKSNAILKILSISVRTPA